MEIAKIRKLNPKELVAEIGKTKMQLVQLKSEVAMHRVKNWNSLTSARKYLARLLTIQNEQKIIKSLSHEQQ